MKKLKFFVLAAVLAVASVVGAYVSYQANQEKLLSQEQDILLNENIEALTCFEIGGYLIPASMREFYFSEQAPDSSGRRVTKTYVQRECVFELALRLCEYYKQGTFLVETYYN